MLSTLIPALLLWTAFAANTTNRYAVTPQLDTGHAVIVNLCTFPVYIWIIDSDRNPTAPTTILPGATWYEQFVVPTTGGVSCKISRTPSIDVITQFEYDLNRTASTVSFDGSNVNCATGTCPFEEEGVDIETTNENCINKACAPGERPCQQFYTVWNDDAKAMSVSTLVLSKAVSPY